MSESLCVCVCICLSPCGQDCCGTHVVPRQAAAVAKVIEIFARTKTDQTKNIDINQRILPLNLFPFQPKREKGRLENNLVLGGCCWCLSCCCILHCDETRHTRTRIPRKEVGVCVCVCVCMCVCICGWSIRFDAMKLLFRSNRIKIEVVERGVTFLLLFFLMRVLFFVISPFF